MTSLVWNVSAADEMCFGWMIVVLTRHGSVVAACQHPCFYADVHAKSFLHAVLGHTSEHRIHT